MLKTHFSHQRPRPAPAGRECQGTDPPESVNNSGWMTQTRDLGSREYGGEIHGEPYPDLRGVGRVVKWLGDGGVASV